MPKKAVLETTEKTTAIIDLSEDPEFSKFLKVQKKSTRNTYSAYLRRLKEFTTESGAEILAHREEWLTKIFEFGHYLEEKGYSSCYVQSCLGCVRGFFASNRKPLEFTKNERQKLRRRSRKTEDFYLNIDHFKTMAGFCGTLKEKWVLIVGKSLGFRSVDFVKINYGQLRSIQDQLDKPAPIFLGEIRAEKEDTKYFAFLDSDTIPIVKAILEASKDKPNNESVLMTKSKKLRNTYQTMYKGELSEILRSIAKRAGIQAGNRRIRFHLLRKFLADNLSRFMSESKWKQILGKQIDESAYVGAESLKEDYSRAMPSIVISGNGTNKKVSELEDENKKLKDEIERLKTEQKEKDDLLKIVVKRSLESEERRKFSPSRFKKTKFLPSRFKEPKMGLDASEINKRQTEISKRRTETEKLRKFVEEG